MYRQITRNKRRGVVVALLLVSGLSAAGVLAGSPAGAQTQITTATGLTCGSKVYRVLFWPQGHPAVPSVGFGSYPIPHSELYVGKGRKYPDSQFAAFIDNKGSANSSSNCTPASVQLGTIPAKQLRKVTRAATLSCTLTKVPTVDVVPTSSVPSGLEITVGKHAVAEETIGTPSKLSYDKRFCKASAAPS